MDVTIATFDKKRHRRDGFMCGNSALDDYLLKRAAQDSANNVAVIFVLTEVNKAEIIGYYTLSAFSVDVTELDHTLTQKLPRYPLLPAILLGRLAIHNRYQKRRFGDKLLVDALKRAYEASQHVASMAVVVDAIDDTARLFYEKYGFMCLKNYPMRLYLPMTTIKKLTTLPI